MPHFYTPWKRKKSFGFLFSGCIEMGYWRKNFTFVDIKHKKNLNSLSFLNKHFYMMNCFTLFERIKNEWKVTNMIDVLFFSILFRFLGISLDFSRWQLHTSFARTKFCEWYILLKRSKSTKTAKSNQGRI